MSSAALSNRLGKLIKKSTHHDKDERFMCLSDIATELDHPDCPTLEPPLITTLARTLLTALNDTSSDVQTIAVKALGLLVRRGGSGGEVREVVERLSALLVEEGRDKEDSRDVYVIGMKTIIAHMSSGAAAATAAGGGTGSGSSSAGGEVGGKCLSILITGLQRPSASTSVLLAALDISQQLLLHFASSLPSATLPPLLDALTPLLAHSDPAVPKRAIATLGPLVSQLPDRLFSTLMDRITSAHHSDAYTYLTAITTVSTHAGSRIRPYLPDMFTQLQRFCQPSDDSKEEGERQTVEEEAVDREREERVMSVYEDVLLAFEAMLCKCGGEVYGYVGVMVDICLRMSRYDPNYTTAHNDNTCMEEDDTKEAGGGEERGTGGSGGGWDDEDDGGGVMDDENENDDNSWKVRRAALRCLQSLITSKPDLFASTYFTAVFDTLIERLTERDDNVRLNVLECISAAVKECVVSSRESDAAAAGTSLSQFTSSSGQSAASSHIHSLLLQANLPVPVHTRPSLSLLSAKLPLLFSTTLSIHSRQPLDTRRATLDVWKSVVGVMEGGCDKQLPLLLPALLSDAAHSDVRLRTDALQVLRLVLELHPAALLSPYVGAVCDACVDAMAASYLKLKAEALRLAAALLTLTHDKPLIAQLYAAVYTQLLLTDVDAEVKEVALSTMAMLLSKHHALLPKGAVESTLPVFHARLGNEVTRLSALRAITRLTTSASLSLASILPAMLADLLQLLRRDNAILRQETLATILALARTQHDSTGKGGNNTATASKQLWSGVVSDCQTYIDDRDMHVSTLAMDTVRQVVLRYDSSCAVEGGAPLMARLLRLLQSPLMQQGAALHSITALFTALVAVSPTAAAGESAFSYEKMIATLSAVDERMSTSTLVATAQCISAIVSHASETQRNTIVTSLLASLSQAATTEQQASSLASLQLCLYSVGSIGRLHNLSTQHLTAFSVVSAPLSNRSDAVKQAAAAAVGWLSAGAVDECLPLLLRLVDGADDSRYLGLCALLRMVQTFSAITSAGSSVTAVVTSPSHATRADGAGDGDVLPHVSAITAVLFRYCDSDDEAVRALVSECLGCVTVIEPQSVLPALQQRVTDTSARVREVVITAIRYAVPTTSAADSGPVQSNLQWLNLLSALSPALPAFFPLLSDPSLSVQRNALLTVTSLMHSHRPLVQPHLSLLLPLLYPPLLPQPHHVRTVNLGPFQHRVDDGLPLRQAALTALATLFSHLHTPEQAVREYVQRALKAGLAGELGDGVAGLVWEELERVSVRYDGVVVGEVDGLVPDMMKSIREQLKLAKGDGGADSAASAAGGSGGGGGSDVAVRAKDVLRACVRTLLALQRLRGVEGNAVFQEFYARVLKTQVLVTIMGEMRASER